MIKETKSKKSTEGGLSMRLRACMLAIAVLAPLRAFAQTPAPGEAAPPPAAPPVEAAPPPAAPPPAPAPVVIAPAPVAAPVPVASAVPVPKITWGGLIDTYYLYNFIRPDGANSLLNPVGRAFDTNANSITLNYAKVSMNASIDPVSFQLDMGYGAIGTIINSNNNGTSLSPTIMAGTAVGGSFIIQQAYGTIALPGNLTLDFGKFVTTAGAEVIEASKNWLYSRSFLFNAIPFVHTGARANLKVSDALTLQASLVNGWNNDPDNNAWKTIGLNASITVSPALAIIPTVYFGKEGGPQGVTGPTPGDLRVLADLVVALTVSDVFGLNLNVDYIKAYDNVADDYLFGAALMGRFVLSEHANIAARGEWVRTHTADVNQDVMEGTLMVGLPVGKNFELRPEIRYDHGGQDTLFFNGKNNQFTGEIAALTYF